MNTAPFLAAIRAAAERARQREAAGSGSGPPAGAGRDATVPRAGGPAPGPAGALRHGLAETLRKLHARGPSPRPTGMVPKVEVPDGAAFLPRTVSCAAGSRDYRLYVPSALPAGPRPLVVMLHGCTQGPEDFAVGTGMNALAERHGFLVAYPEQARQANRMGCWSWFEPAHQRRSAGEPAIIAAMVAGLADERPVDRAKIFVAGLSAGGAMAAVLMATHPDLFAGVAIHSGLPFGVAHDMPSALAAMRGERGSRRVAGRRLAAGDMPRLIVFHGDADTTVHPANGAALADEASAAIGRSASEVSSSGTAGGRSFSRSVTCDAQGRAFVEQWVVHGGGHAWAGGNPAGILHRSRAAPTRQPR